MSSFIPEEIMFDILTRLPAKSLSRLRCVSKSWNNLIKNPHFLKLQLNHSLKYGEHGIVYNCESCDGKICCVDYDSSSSRLSNSVVHIDYPLDHKTGNRIIDSCNGLVCYLSSQKEIMIWNPFTKDYRKLSTPPKPDLDPSYVYDFYSYSKYGFGYDSKTDDYKFARMVKCPGSSTEISVYSLKLNLWKTYRDIPFLLPFNGGLVLFQGIFHWVGDRSRNIEISRDFPRGFKLPKIIGCLDTGSETFKEIPLPQHFAELFGIFVCVLGGFLYIIGFRYVNIGSEAWMMKDYGVHESWTKMFNIRETSSNLVGAGCLNLKHYFKSGVILVQVDNGRCLL
ncbi:F-box/kelch-repeat protein At3g06240-like [Papaver somniferum]|uniref:F-box/kelch-repeat protein At3g06240-like n=1 Tax=Papaver somniferum TaxID=3469 RepID=UPI000E7056F0|nr:F-box/kelch-repeat protein At3g06240-like [Papaver somniferum]